MGANLRQSLRAEQWYGKVDALPAAMPRWDLPDGKVSAVSVASARWRVVPLRIPTVPAGMYLWQIACLQTAYTFQTSRKQVDPHCLAQHHAAYIADPASDQRWQRVQVGLSRANLVAARLDARLSLRRFKLRLLFVCTSAAGQCSSD